MTICRSNSPVDVTSMLAQNGVTSTTSGPGIHTPATFICSSHRKRSRSQEREYAQGRRFEQSQREISMIASLTCRSLRLREANYSELRGTLLSNWGMASIRLYTLTVVFVLVEWNNAVFYSNKIAYSLVNKSLVLNKTSKGDRGKRAL